MNAGDLFNEINLAFQVAPPTRRLNSNSGTGVSGTGVPPVTILHRRDAGATRQEFFVPQRREDAFNRVGRHLNAEYAFDLRQPQRDRLEGLALHADIDHAGSEFASS